MTKDLNTGQSEIDVRKVACEILRRLEDLFSSFQKLSIAVFGDVMLDEYLIGDSTRISPEAPVPVVKVEKTYCTPGGSANTSVNIRVIGGCRVKVFSVVGEDETADKIEEELRKLGIETFFVRERERITPKKTRVIARGQQVIRIDNETTNRARSELVSSLLSEFLSDRFDVVVFSDYAKGNIVPELNEIISKTRSICDPKPKNIRIFQNAYMILPNEKEAQEIYQVVLNDSDQEFQDERDVMCKLMDKVGLKKIVVTKGARGLLLLSSDRQLLRVPALAKEVYDVTGAGDTVSSVFALCEGIGLEDEKTALLSSVAASVKVSHRGTYAPTREEITASLRTLCEMKSSSYSER